MEDCIFCKIVSGDIPSKKVYENEDVLAFNDVNPIAPVHVLIIPKKHIENLMQVNPEDEEIMVKIIDACKEVAKIMGVDEKGFRLITNCGPDSGQEVMHLHFHLIGGKKLGTKTAG